MEFSQPLALALVQSEDCFPVDFDDAWRWVGWPKKQHGKDVLLHNFLEGSDFLRKGVKSPSGGRPREHIVLTIDCFKSLGMMAGTEQGRKIRRYFLDCERQAKTVIPAQQHEIEKLKLELALAQTRERLAGATQVLALISPGLPALAFGKPDAVIEVERPVTVVTDAYGRSERYDGATITELAKRYGFGKGRKANQQCREWLRSVGIRDEDWIEEPAAHVTKKLPRELMRRLDDHFYGGEGERQRNLGEGA